MGTGLGRESGGGSLHSGGRPGQGRVKVESPGEVSDPREGSERRSPLETGVSRPEDLQSCHLQAHSWERRREALFAGEDSDFGLEQGEF